MRAFITYGGVVGKVSSIKRERRFYIANNIYFFASPIGALSKRRLCIIVKRYNDRKIIPGEYYDKNYKQCL